MVRVLPHYVLVLGVGIATALFYIVSSFIPMGFVFQSLVFIGVGVWLGRRKPQAWCYSALLLVAPTIAFLAYVFRNLGWLPRADGLGINHHLALIMFPLASLIGAWWGTRKSNLSQGTRRSNSSRSIPT